MLALARTSPALSADPSEALAVMMEHYGPLVRRIAYGYLNDPHAAEDVAQEVFLRAFRAWHNFRGEANVRTWLTRIAINCARDHRRRSANREVLSDLSFSPGEAEDIESAAIESVREGELMAYLQELLPAFRQVTYLHYFLDLSTPQIAAITGAGTNTVRTRLFRARMLLRQRLEREQRPPR